MAVYREGIKEVVYSRNDSAFVVFGDSVFSIYVYVAGYSVCSLSSKQRDPSSVALPEVSSIFPH